MTLPFILEVSLHQISGAKRITGYTGTIKSASCPDAIRAAHSKQEEIGPGSRNWNESRSMSVTEASPLPLLPTQKIKNKKAPSSAEELNLSISNGHMFAEMETLMMYLSLAHMCKQVYFVGVYMCTHAHVNLCMIVGMEITVPSMCVHLSVCASKKYKKLR